MYSGISSPSELNRILPPVEIASNTSSSNIIYDSRQSKLSPTSPNGQRFGYKSTSSSRISGSARKIQHSQNGSTGSGTNTVADSNTIRIKVNQAMKWSVCRAKIALFSGMHEQNRFKAKRGWIKHSHDKRMEIVIQTRVRKIFISVIMKIVFEMSEISQTKH